MTQLPTTEAEVRYAEHQRRIAWVNEHAWKYETVRRRSLRVPLAKALLALARRIAPVYPETERQTDAFAQS